MDDESTIWSFLPPLWVLRGADFQSVADQQLTKVGSFTRYVVDRIVAINRSGGFSVTCLGGIYTGAGKTGNAIVSAVQSWAALTVPGKFVNATLAGILASDEQSGPTLFLSLTTGNLVGLTADVFVFGWPTD